MSSELSRLFLARRGDTARTDARQRTGRTDIPLNAVGEHHAHQFGERLRRFPFASVITSPLQHATRTCELAGFGTVAKVDPDLVEWDHGPCEGLVLREIKKERLTCRDGCPKVSLSKSSPPE